MLRGWAAWGKGGRGGRRVYVRENNGRDEGGYDVLLVRGRYRKERKGNLQEGRSYSWRGLPWEEEVGRKGEEAIGCLRKDCGKGGACGKERKVEGEREM